MNYGHSTFVSLSLPALHNLIVHHHQLPALSHTNYVLHFLGHVQFIHLACHFLSTISSEAPLFSIALCITPLGLNSVYNNCARAT